MRLRQDNGIKTYLIKLGSAEFEGKVKTLPQVGGGHVGRITADGCLHKGEAGLRGCLDGVGVGGGWGVVVVFK